MRIMLVLCLTVLGACGQEGTPSVDMVEPAAAKKTEARPFSPDDVQLSVLGRDPGALDSRDTRVRLYSPFYRIMLRNGSSRDIWVDGYSPDRPDYVVEMRSHDDVWTAIGPRNRAGFTVHQIGPGESHVFQWGITDWQDWRLAPKEGQKIRFAINFGLTAHAPQTQVKSGPVDYEGSLRPSNPARSSK